MYGAASGQVERKKYGEAVTDYSGVTVSVNDDGVTVSYDEETGRFTVSNAVVGTYYRLTVSKEGYEDYQTEFAVQEGSDTVIGGTEGITLNFLYATLDRGGSGAAIDHVNKTISLGGGNTAPDVDGKESSKATLVAEETTSSESYFFDFTVKQTETTSDGGGWRRFSVTTTDSNVGFLFIYNTNDTAAESGTVRAIAQDTIAEDGGMLLPVGFNTLEQLQTGVKFRIIKAGTQITLYAAGADGSYEQIAATSCAAEAENVFSFRGSYDTWQFSEISFTDVEYVAEVPPTSTEEGTEAHFTDADGNYYDITGKVIVPHLVDEILDGVIPRDGEDRERIPLGFEPVLHLHAHHAVGTRIIDPEKVFDLVPIFVRRDEGVRVDGAVIAAARGKACGDIGVLFMPCAVDRGIEECILCIVVRVVLAVVRMHVLLPHALGIGEIDHVEGAFGAVGDGSVHEIDPVPFIFSRYARIRIGRGAEIHDVPLVFLVVHDLGRPYARSCLRA